MRTPKRRSAIAAALAQPRYRRQVIDMKRRLRKARDKATREQLKETR